MANEWLVNAPCIFCLLVLMEKAFFAMYDYYVRGMCQKIVHSFASEKKVLIINRTISLYKIFFAEFFVAVECGCQCEAKCMNEKKIGALSFGEPCFFLSLPLGIYLNFLISRDNLRLNHCLTHYRVLTQTLHCLHTRCG